eukprot:TRINITY_DN70093_c0_g1_i1.p1 TRINITY_DN70093_c0_g1~~TRINITY_DN70093_c0_g1_i1.p1  ORF type:complete len:922 (+),score=215.31 TRINITY_DN70093_c0_g1_i1:72-2837(+)
MQVGQRLTGTLRAHVGMDLKQRAAAAAALEDAEAAGVDRYAGALMHEMGDESKPLDSRLEAARLLTACIGSSDPCRQEDFAACWRAAQPRVRVQLRNMALQLLGAVLPEAREAAALATATLGRIDLPAGEWDDMVQQLCASATAGHTGSGGLVLTAEARRRLRESSLTCIGRLCEQADHSPALRSYLMPFAGDLLVPVTTAMRQEEGDPAARLAAVTAVERMVGFVEEVMVGAEHSAQRDFLVRVLCSTAAADTCDDEAARAKAYRCLCRIAANYYQSLEGYMQYLLTLSLTTLRSDSAPVLLQALEFWITLSEVEQEMLEAERVGQPAALRCRQYVLGACEYLFEPLWPLLCRQDETADEEEWDVAAAAAGCAQGLANCVGDACLPHAMPIVSANFNSESWRCQEAATMLLVCILEGTSTEGPLQTLLPNVVPTLLKNMRSPAVLLRETTAWAVGRCAEFHPVTLSASYLRQALEVLVGSLRDPEPRIAAKGCYAILHVAAAMGDEGRPQRGANALSPYFQVVVAALLQAADREDAGRNGLRLSAREALRSCCAAASRDCIPVLMQLMPLVVGDLQRAARHPDLQCPLLAVAAALARKLHGKDLGPCADSLLQLALPLCGDPLPRPRDPRAIPPPPPRELDGEPVLTAQAAASLPPSDAPPARLKEEAMVCIAAVAESLRDGFARYVGAALPRLLAALGDYAYPRVARVAASALRDVQSAAPAAAEPYADEVILTVFRGLRSTELDRAAKPAFVAVLGSTAVTMGGRFDRYADMCCAVMMAASAAIEQRSAAAAEGGGPEAEKLLRLRTEMRERCARAYSGMLQALRRGRQDDAMPARTAQIFDHLRLLCAAREDEPPQVADAALGLVIDLAGACGRRGEQALKERCVDELLSACADADDPQMRELAAAAQQARSTAHHH